MTDEIVVKVEGDEGAAAEVKETVGEVIDAAKEIAELIDDARQEGEHAAAVVEQVTYSLDDLWGEVARLNERVGTLIDLVMGVSDQVAALSVLEVAELVETETSATVEDVVETAELIEDVTPEKEVVETAVTPQIREKKKARWL